MHKAEKVCTQYFSRYQKRMGMPEQFWTEVAKQIYNKEKVQDGNAQVDTSFNTGRRSSGILRSIGRPPANSSKAITLTVSAVCI